MEDAHVQREDLPKRKAWEKKAKKSKEHASLSHAGLRKKNYHFNIKKDTGHI